MVIFFLSSYTFKSQFLNSLRPVFYFLAEFFCYALGICSSKELNPSLGVRHIVELFQVS